MKNVFYRFLSLALVLGLACAAALGQENRDIRSLTVDDYFRIHHVSDPQISPDGKWVAFVISTMDLEENTSESRIWMMTADGGQAIPMTAKGSSASRPRWSPDGKYLSFLAARDREKNQVWTLFREGGDSMQLTEVAQGVKSYDWSPDGARLLLTLKDPKPGELEEDSADKGKEKETPKPWVIDRLQFKQDYIGYLDRRRTHLYVFDVESKATTQITSGDFDDSGAVWSPDGKSVAFVSNRTDEPDNNYNTDIWVVAADNSDQGKTLLQVTKNTGADSSPTWSPDGKSIAHISVTDTDALVYATPHLAVVSSQGGEANVLTKKLDRHMSNPRFSLDGESIYFILEDSGERQLARIPAGGGTVERFIADSQIINGFEIGKDGTIAALVTGPHLPPEVFLYREGELKQLSHANAKLLSEVRLGAVEEVRFKSKDGTEIEAFVVKPPAFDPSIRYPALLRIHGGPVSQYDYGFHFQAQLFAADGYVVVLPNPRGSSGYGQDFSLSIWKAWGDKDYEDVMASVDYVIEQGFADPDRLGVGGWSYGGLLTNHVIVKTGRFEAAITGASSTLYVSNYGHDHYQRWWESELGVPWKKENRTIWEKLSPFNYVENVTTPTLIVGGEKDWNVPIINSEQLYQALKRLGRTTQLVVYPGEFHGIQTPSFIKDLYERYLDWYGKYVKGSASTD
jgi:dipeptidyl aminopeptidase/acylaminoacyl peptidase